MFTYVFALNQSNALDDHEISFCSQIDQSKPFLGPR